MRRGGERREVGLRRVRHTAKLGWRAAARERPVRFDSGRWARLARAAACSVCRVMVPCRCAVPGGGAGARMRHPYWLLSPRKGHATEYAKSPRHGRRSLGGDVRVVGQGARSHCARGERVRALPLPGEEDVPRHQARRNARSAVLAFLGPRPTTVRPRHPPVPLPTAFPAAAFRRGRGEHSGGVRGGD
jgi:hypothetical protein